MAGRPRIHSNILQMRGSFKKDPQRKREDAQASGPFNAAPPDHLPTAFVPAWRYLVERLPAVALGNSDEVAVEIAAGLLAQYWMTRDLDTVKELRAWLGKLGMTLQDRAKLPGQGPQKPANDFAGM